MRRLFAGLLFVIPTLAFAQKEILGVGGCIGGSTCTERSLRVPLEDRPVIAIGFHAHDDIGEKAGGLLRVKIDNEIVGDRIDIPRNGETFTFQVDAVSGRFLIFEPAADEEVVVGKIAVKYGTVRREDRDDNRTPFGDGWRRYPSAGGCIGGDECGQNGKRITIALEDVPVLGIRFFAHDAIGQRTDGRLKVRIDTQVLNDYLDVQRVGKLHEFEVDNLHGSRLVIETATDDEVLIKDIDVLYKRERHDDPWSGGAGGSSGGSREVTDVGKCIGGPQCGGLNTRIRIPIYGRSVNNIRFYGRHMGPAAGARLRIRIDDQIVENAFDVSREGRTLIVDGKRLRGESVIFEAAGYEDIEVRQIRVQFEED